MSLQCWLVFLKHMGIHPKAVLLKSTSIVIKYRQRSSCSEVFLRIPVLKYFSEFRKAHAMDRQRSAAQLFPYEFWDMFQVKLLLLSMLLRYELLKFSVKLHLLVKISTTFSARILMAILLCFIHKIEYTLELDCGISQAKIEWNSYLLAFMEDKSK